MLSKSGMVESWQHSNSALGWLLWEHHMAAASPMPGGVKGKGSNCLGELHCFLGR